VLVISSFAALFRDYCVGQVLVQRGIEDKKLTNAVFSLGVDVSVILFLAQSTLALPLSRFFHEPLVFPLVLAISINFLIGAGAGSHTAILQHRLKFRELAFCDSLSAFARSATTVICACFGLGIWSFAAGEIMMISTDSFLKRKYSGYPFRYHLKIDPKIIAEVKSFILNILSSRIAAQINSTSDNLVVGRFVGATQLGYYGLAYQISVIPGQALVQISRVLFPSLAQANQSRRGELLGQVLYVYAVLASLVYGSIFLLAPILISLVYGDKWLPCVPVLQLLVFSVFGGTSMNFLGSALLSTGNAALPAKVDWITSVVSITGYMIGATVGGIYGVAVASLTIMGIAAPSMYWFAAHRFSDLDVSTSFNYIKAPVITLLVSLISIKLAEFYISGIPLIIQTAIFVLLYLVILTFLSEKSIKQRIYSIISAKI
jgi:O-antigen/teichoic acid export membrane protein